MFRNYIVIALEPNRRYLLTVADEPATGEPTSAPYRLRPSRLRLLALVSAT